jgi:broad specificity phosphatase PhoE
VLRLVVVRHGETEWSRLGRHTSRTDIPLTPEGEEAGRLVALRLADHHFAAVFTSPLRRARDTSGLAGFGHAEIEPNLTEWDYGEFEGITTADIRRQRPGWSIWDDDPAGGETAQQVAHRADQVLARVASVDGDVLVFSHAHFLRVLAARWLGYPPADGRHLALSTAAISILGWQREDRVLELWNDTSHLDIAMRGDWDRLASETGH